MGELHRIPLYQKNPAREVAYLKSNNPEGFRAWSEADVAKYEARHPVGAKARLALDLLLYTGVRRSDVVKLGPQMERDGKLIFTETKGRGRIIKTHELPILPALRASIDATPPLLNICFPLPKGSSQTALMRRLSGRSAPIRERFRLEY